MKPGRFVLLAVLASDLFGNGASSQEPRRSAVATDAPRVTIVEVKLLVGADGGALHAQQWSRLLEPLDIAIQIQRARGDDKPEVRERTVGTIRYVTATGSLERSGQIRFPGKQFDQGDGVRLREWIQELKTYGAQGTPEGQPQWGLTDEQFRKLYDSLRKPIEAEVQDLPLPDAIARLPLPAELRVRFRSEAGAAVRAQKTRQDLRGFTAATGLAVILNDCGLGFRPERTPEGTIELVIELLGERRQLWSVGWPLQAQRLKAAPKLFALTPIELDDVPLLDVLTTVTELTGTPVLIDHYEIERARIDLSSLSVSVKRASTSWSLVLKNVVVPHKLSREIWQDESGRAFVWITTNRPGRSAE